MLVNSVFFYKKMSMFASFSSLTRKSIFEYFLFIFNDLFDTILKRKDLL